jgi:hypothetical protein
MRRHVSRMSSGRFFLRYLLRTEANLSERLTLLDPQDLERRSGRSGITFRAASQQLKYFPGFRRRTLG